MRTVAELTEREKENLLILYAKILANFPGHQHVDPSSKEFNESLKKGAKYLAPFIYSDVEEPK
jgi:hypothetical protein